MVPDNKQVILENFLRYLQHPWQNFFTDLSSDTAFPVKFYPNQCLCVVLLSPALTYFEIKSFSQKTISPDQYKVIEEKGEKLQFDPNHPQADENGYVKMPDINMVEEMVDLISASRTYEANVTVINAAKQMAKRALEI